MIFLLFFSLAANAADLPGHEVYVAPQVQPTTAAPVVSAASSKSVRKSVRGIGNIPSEYLAGPKRSSTVSELVQPPRGSVEIYRALKVGDSVDVRVEHSVIAFPDESAPIVASIESGSLRGIKMIGESKLEANTKRIFIEFHRLVLGQQIFQMKGVGLSSAGQPGLNGEYHSRELEYFTGDFIASFVAGYFDSLVPRRTNAFGQIESDPSVDSAVKKGLASGALSTADRFREKLKKVPEFSEIKGPFDLNVLILEQAKSNN